MAAPSPGLPPFTRNLYDINIVSRILDSWNYFEVLDYIDAFPEQVVEVFNWGRRATGPWPNQHLPIITHELAIVWHAIRLGIPTPQNPAPGSLWTGVANLNCPIHHWVATDRLKDLLIPLQKAELWNPLSWSPKGESYYSIASSQMAHNVRAYIADHAVGDRDFCLAQPFIQAVIPANTPGTSDILTHLELMALNEPQDVFFNLWNASGPHGNAQMIFGDRGKRRLCEIATARDAQFFLRNNHLNIAFCMPRVGDPVPAGHVFTNGRGTAYHCAVRNRDINFITFLNQYIPEQINWVQGEEAGTPLALAHRLDRIRHFQRLLESAADGTQYTRLWLARDVPDPRDPYLQQLCSWIRWSGTAPGMRTLALHSLVRGVRRKFTQVENNNTLTGVRKRYQKKKAVRWAERIIWTFKQGNDHGKPDTRERDGDGRTPFMLAQHLGVFQLCGALREPYNLR